MDVLFNGSEEGQDEFILKNKTPKKEPPNIRDPAVFAPIFEEKNRDLVLYFTRPVMDGFLSLLDDLDYLHQRNTGQSLFKSFTWSTKTTELEKIIKQIANPLTKKTMQDKYNALLTSAKKVPIDRAHSYSVIRNTVVNLVKSVVEQDVAVRDELSLGQLE